MMAVANVLVLSRTAHPAEKIAHIRVIAVSVSEHSDEAKAFREGLREAGYTEGWDILIEWWFGGGRYDRVSEAVADLAQRKPDVIVVELTAKWRKRGFDLGFGAGIAQGFATIGAVGFEGRWDYGAIGTVTNLAARLCSEAKPGQILISQKAAAAVEDFIELESVGELQLKGFLKPVPASNILKLKQ
jgi:class 3 adenylate cyclase